MRSGRSVNDSINLIRKDEKIANYLESVWHCLIPAYTVLARSRCLENYFDFGTRRDIKRLQSEVSYLC